MYTGIYVYVENINFETDIYIKITKKPRWCCQMETFSKLLALCVGKSPITSIFPAQRLVTSSSDVFFDLRLNKRWVNNHEAGD